VLDDARPPNVDVIVHRPSAEEQVLIIGINKSLYLWNNGRIERAVHERLGTMHRYGNVDDDQM
jgi:hypothetical protein